MTMTANPNVAAAAVEKADFASALRSKTIACRVRHEKLGVRKALTREQLKAAAEEFHADAKVLSAGKKILDSRDPAFRAVVRVRSQATGYWKAHTAPFPEPGIRLLRRDGVDLFVAQMTRLKAELTEAAAALQGKYAELRGKAEQQLGDLYNPSDYPARIDQEFALEWDFPSVEPPKYLKDIHPALYEQESQRIRARFEEAVRLSEEAFTAKFHELVAHLADRLKGGADGKPKVFRDTAVENLNGFFEQFRNLDVGSSGELQRLVDQAKQAVAGIKPDDLRGDQTLATNVGDALAKIALDVDAMMVNVPTRKFNLDDEDDGQEAA